MFSYFSPRKLNKKTGKTKMSIYDFENKSRRKFPNEKSENLALEEFAQRLGIENNLYKENKEYRDILIKFILNYHILIQSYDALISREQKWRFVFAFMSLSFLCLIPILVYAGPYFLKESVVPYLKFYIPLPSSVDPFAQITTILTGLLTVQKFLSSWLDKRKIIGSFKKARSDLKTKLYTFEDKWRGQATDAIDNSKLKNEFLQEARIAIREAQTIVEEEQSQYFEAITNPSIDIGAMLIEARKSAKTTISDLIPSQTEKHQQELFEKRKSIQMLDTEIIQRDKLINETHSNPNLSDIDKKSIVETQQKKITELKEKLVIEKSLLETLERIKLI